MRESARDEAQWLSNALPLWELHLCKSCECLKPWLEGQTNTKLGPQNTIRKVLKHRWFKGPHIFHLNLICISYDQKKRWESNWEFDSQLQIPSQQGQMKSNWSMLYTIGKIFAKVIRYFSLNFKTYLIWERYERPKIWDIKSPIKKWHLDVILAERHRVYYREGSDASSKKLWAVWSLCLMFSLLSVLHHFHLICINRPLFLFVYVDIILNSCLWVCPCPIQELQHALLPLKCCELKSVPQLFSSSIVSLWDPPLSSLKSLGVCHVPIGFSIVMIIVLLISMFTNSKSGWWNHTLIILCWNVWMCHHLFWQVYEGYILNIE
jgi:hypothetical protein